MRTPAPDRRARTPQIDAIIILPSIDLSTRKMTLQQLIAVAAPWEYVTSLRTRNVGKETEWGCSLFDVRSRMAVHVNTHTAIWKNGSLLVEAERFSATHPWEALLSPFSSSYWPCTSSGGPAPPCDGTAHTYRRGTRAAVIMPLPSGELWRGRGLAIQLAGSTMRPCMETAGQHACKNRAGHQ